MMSTAVSRVFTKTNQEGRSESSPNQFFISIHRTVGPLHQIYFLVRKVETLLFTLLKHINTHF